MLKENLSFGYNLAISWLYKYLVCTYVCKMVYYVSVKAIWPYQFMCWVHILDTNNCFINFDLIDIFRLK